MDLIIRRLEQGDDIGALTALLHRAYASLADLGFRYTATHQSPEVTKRRCDAGSCLVAVVDGVIVGTVTYYSPQQTEHSRWYDRSEVASFGQFGVEPARQGLGIGAKLMEAVEAMALADGAAEIACDTAEGATHLIEMYGRRGYRLVGRVDWDETNYESVVLSKELGGTT
jgi:ribosomal protein S18 acetylase RimI-like enzyme